jgi:hypothetical protein
MAGYWETKVSWATDDERIIAFSKGIGMGSRVHFPIRWVFGIFDDAQQAWHFKSGVEAIMVVLLVSVNWSHRYREDRLLDFKVQPSGISRS